MLQKIILSTMLIISQVALKAQQPLFNQQYGTAADYKRLWFLNIQYIQSWVRSDTATYNKLLWAADFVHQSSSNGQLYPKKDILLLFGQPRFEGIEYFYADNTDIRFITDSAAVISSKPPYLGKGDAREFVTRYNDVYVKRRGNWICVSANITAVTAPGTALPVIKTIPPPTEFITVMEGTEKERTAIAGLYSKTRELLEQPEKAKAKTLLADDFMLLAADGHMYSMQQLLTNGKTAADRGKHTIENRFIRFVAADVAMVHGTQVYTTAKGVMSGIQFNDIYVKRGNEWRCVSSNNTPLKN